MCVFMRLRAEFSMRSDCILFKYQKCVHSDPSYCRQKFLNWVAFLKRIAKNQGLNHPYFFWPNAVSGCCIMLHLTPKFFLEQRLYACSVFQGARRHRKFHEDCSQKLQYASRFVWVFFFLPLVNSIINIILLRLLDQYTDMGFLKIIFRYPFFADINCFWVIY